MNRPREAQPAGRPAASLSTEFGQWLQAGGYHPATCHAYVRVVRAVLDEAYPWNRLDTLSTRLCQLLEHEKGLDSAYERTTSRRARAKLVEYLRFRQGRVSSESSVAFDPDGQWPNLPSWMVNDLEAFVRRQRRRWSVRTIQAYTRDLTRRLNKVLGFLVAQVSATTWDDFRLAHAEAFIDHELARGLKPHSVNADLTLLRSLFGFLETEGQIGRSPYEHLPQVDPGQRVPRFLTNGEVTRIEQDLRSQVDRASAPEAQRSTRFDLAWFYLLYHGGLRLSEVAYLELGDLDLTGQRLIVRSGKGQKDRSVPLTARCCQALQAYLEVRGPTLTARLLVLRHHPATTYGLRERILNCAERTGIAVRAHRLRHTIATQLINAEMPVTSLQRFLGHEDLDKTMIYAQVADQTLVRDYTQGMQRIEQAQTPAAVQVALLPVSSDRQHVVELLQRLAQPNLTAEQRMATVLEMQTLFPGDLPNAAEGRLVDPATQVG